MWSQGTRRPAVLNQSGLSERLSFRVWATSWRRAWICERGAWRRKVAKWAYVLCAAIGVGTMRLASLPRLGKARAWAVGLALKWGWKSRGSAAVGMFELWRTNSRGRLVVTM